MPPMALLSSSLLSLNAHPCSRRAQAATLQPEFSCSIDQHELKENRGPLTVSEHSGHETSKKNANHTGRTQTKFELIWWEPQEPRKRGSVGVPSRRHAAIEGRTAE